MSLRGTISSVAIPLVALLPLSLSACSEELGGEGPDGTGGTSLPATGGSQSGSGGSLVGSGGGTASGGTSTAAGGSQPGAGGSAIGAGGSANGAGGSANGAGGSANGAGGSANGAGGSTNSGGSSSGGGGSSGTAEWGMVENPSAECTVPEMPSFNSLTANSNLPDPFTKMDGTRITDRSEWLCRREEILQQHYEFIWGEKPVPPEGATTGSVSESMISVSVEDGGSTQFNLTVELNGASTPAPAIICYDGGLGCATPRPDGVARITFSAIEGQGGDGPKNGPFYAVYGSDHPAGYLTAQAWQISRVLDVLEQDPSVIDPYRVGVTGCSRNGKGAFVGGALDNRVALTIPVESGLGGTVGLRLVETIGGGEWPYHGISYVRWMSEVALGPFTSGNNAGADNTDKLPVDMHEMMALIAPRGLYIVDNPGIDNLDPGPAWVAANAGKRVFEALGVGDHMAYQGAGGSHCAWRSQYTPSFNAMVDKFLLGNDSADTGNVATDYSGANPDSHMDWDVPTLSGEL